MKKINWNLGRFEKLVFCPNDIQVLISLENHRLWLGCDSWFHLIVIVS